MSASGLHEEYAVYDELPKPVREALRITSVELSAAEAITALERYGVEGTVAKIRSFDWQMRQLHRRFNETEWPKE